jgi:hypothetical protein
MAADRSATLADLPFSALGPFLDSRSLASVRMTCRVIATVTAKTSLQRLRLTGHDWSVPAPFDRAPLQPQRYESVTELQLREDPAACTGTHLMLPPPVASLAATWTGLQVRAGWQPRHRSPRCRHRPLPPPLRLRARDCVHQHSASAPCQSLLACHHHAMLT